MIIICGIDFSPASQDALTAAAAVARAQGATRLIIVHAAASGPADHELAEIRARLDGLAATVAGAATQIRTELIVGDPVASVCALAETEGGDLVVVAAKGHSNAPLIRLGGVSERIALESTVPVLIVRDPASLIAWRDNARPLRALVGVDESPACEAGVAWLCARRAVHPIDLVLGSVYYADVAARHYGLPSTNAVDANPEVERLLARDLSRRFSTTPGRGTTTVRPLRGLGRVADHLIELAEAERIDLVVVGTSRVGGLGRFGSVAAGVVHESPSSILCIPPHVAVTSTVPTLRIALVATDLSEFGARAVPLGFAAVAAAGAQGEVHLVHVVAKAGPDPSGLHTQLRQLAPAGVVASVHTHVVAGDEPADVLAETAARIGADLICIASHGRSGISRAIMGSVADRLLRATRVPVLVTRPKE